MRPYVGRHVLRLAWLVGGIVLSGLLITGGLNASGANAEAGPARTALAPDAVLDEPRHFVSQSIAIDGEVARVLGPRAFTLRSRSVRQGLLVVLTEQGLRAGPAPQEGQAVEADGTIRLLDRREVHALGQEFGLDLSRDPALASYGSHPYLLARSIRPGRR